jgi:hypothetical protein
MSVVGRYVFTYNSQKDFNTEVTVVTENCKFVRQSRAFPVTSVISVISVISVFKSFTGL